MSAARLLAAFCALACAAFGAPALAHDSRPLSITLTQQSDDLYRAVVRAPPTLQVRNAPVVTWPERCEIRSSQSARSEPGSISLLACPQGLEGAEIRVDYPVYNPSLTTLIRLVALDGPTITEMLPPDTLVWTVPEQPDRWDVARDYLRLGFVHIWEGPDHLMFVAGLILLAGRPRRILTAVTGFTLAHSITLSLAVLGLVRLPIAAVEAMIALSILFLAAELARGGDNFSRRHPVALSFVFGLLHGFGFASALGEIGLPAGELAVGLLFFNLGVEAGQLAFIALAGAVFLAWRAARPLARPAVSGAVESRTALVGAYVLGIPAALWFLERSAAALA